MVIILYGYNGFARIAIKLLYVVFLFVIFFLELYAL